MSNEPQQRKLQMRKELLAVGGRLVVPAETYSAFRVSGWGGDGKRIREVSVTSVATRRFEVRTMIDPQRRRSAEHSIVSMIASDAVPSDPQFPLVLTITREERAVRVAGSEAVPLTLYRAERDWIATGQVEDLGVELRVSDIEPAEIVLDLMDIQAIPDDWWD